jgi:DUF4097 and DUF4098 domain-containing protein YvlB
MKRHLFLTAAFSFLVLLVYAQTPDDFSFRSTYKISTPAEMSISTSDGFIVVNDHNSKNIEVFFIVTKNNHVEDIDLEELEEHVEVDIESSNDRLEIRIRHKESSWMKNWRDRYNVSFQINAPSRTACNLKTSDGDISLTGFQGEQSCKTSDGNIDVEDISGNLTADTSDGDIIVLGIEGSIELNTSDGKIMASNIDGNTKVGTSDGNIILEEISGENYAKTSDGNIVFENMRGSLSAQTSDGDIRGNLEQLTDELYLKTSDGNISVTVPDGIGMNVRLKGEDINIQLENFSGKTGDHLVEGTIRGGGVDVEMITSDGDINLNYN